MASNLLIRKPERGDLDAWLALWAGYNAFYGREGSTALPDQITRLTWGRFFKDEEPMYALLAARDGQVVGLVHYLFHRSTTQQRHVCYLQDLFVDPAVRSGGVGRALIEAVYEQAREAGLERVYWQTHETNATAMKLYDQVAENSGFIVYRKDL